jgi:hypothetical protein
MSILTRKTLVYTEVESVYGTAATMSDATSACLVEAADYKLEVQKIARNIYRADLSPSPDLIGRKTGKISFSHELRGGGVVGTECRLGRLLRGCSMVATVKAAPWWGAFYTNGTATPVVAWTTGGSITGTTEAKTLVFVVTTAGVSGAAQCSITADDGTAAQTAVTMTSATPITLATGGLTATVTPAWTGSLVVGQTWVVTVYPAGIAYYPSSDSTAYASLTINMYKDGVLHVLTGAYGTFKVSAQAGQRAMVQFDFMGFYNAPTDFAFPAAPVYEQTLPQQVELGRIHVDGFGVSGPVANLCAVDAFSYDIVNKIDPRMSINAANGYTGFRITERQSTGGIDPEATLVGTQDFWTKFANAKQMPFGIRVGTTPGNSWGIYAPCAQYTGLTYKDRNGLTALDAGLQFNRLNGDDEIMFYAC